VNPTKLAFPLSLAALLGVAAPAQGQATAAEAKAKGDATEAKVQGAAGELHQHGEVKATSAKEKLDRVVPPAPTPAAPAAPAAK
jgi:hypothetical protein